MQIEVYESEFKKIMEQMADYKDPIEKIREKVSQLAQSVKAKSQGFSEFDDIVCDIDRDLCREKLHPTRHDWQSTFAAVYLLADQPGKPRSYQRMHL